MKILTTVALFLVLCISSGCCSRDVIVLLPDRDGQVGAIDISNEKGSVSLDKPGATVKMSGATSAPEFKGIMSEEEINDRFGDALAAEPQQPAKFLLYFQSDSTNLTGESEKVIPAILEEIQSRGSRDISVSGHADRTGSREYNIELSTRRAHAIRDILLAKGVEEKYLIVSSHGENNPLFKTADNVAEPRNRRVEVIVK